MTVSQIRSGEDLKMYEALLALPEIQRARDQIERIEKTHDRPEIRRHLLATSVRLSRTMSQPLHRMVDKCTEKLEINSPIELYAYASPQFNAACFKPEDGRTFIMFSSALLEGLSDAELLFVVGHELGHHLYKHHEIPIGYIVRGKNPAPPRLALDLFTWSRYAEVSADRAGALCSNDLQSVSQALFKLASGISNAGIVQFDLNEFLNQVDDMLAFDEEPGQGAPQQDWFLTHPFSPLRVKALKLFFDSNLMRNDGFDKTILENKVRDIMGLMEPDYMQGKTDTARIMRNLFVASAIAIADIHMGISDKERAVLRKFLEQGRLVDKLDPNQLREVLPKRISEARKRVSLTKRMHVVRDLCIVALAEQAIATEEMELLCKISSGLDIQSEFVVQCLERHTELD